MSIEELRPLKSAFLKEYGHFSDLRFKNIDKSNFFVVDDRESSSSFASDGTPYGWFCEMFATVDLPQSVEVTIRGPLPMNGNVQAWLDSNHVKLIEDKYTFRSTRKSVITPANVDELLALGAALESIVARGAPRYSEASNKYTCPRMAGSLKRLHKVLTSHWSPTNH